MVILITGGAGYIGSQLMLDLAAHPSFKGSTIRVMDNMFREKFCTYWNLPTGVKVEVIDGDIRKEADLERAFKDVDIVFDLAGITNAPISFERKELTMDINVSGGQKVAAWCRKNNALLVYASSASAYGPTKEIVNEESPLRPASPYGESKVQMEQHLTLEAKSGLRTIIYRLGTVYGWSPGMRFDTVVDKFTYFACIGQPLTVYKNALVEARPYAHVRDVTAALIFAVENEKRMQGQIYNVISKNAGIQEVVDAIKKYLPETKSIVTETANLNQLSYVLDDRKLAALGFKPKYSMEDGIREIIEKFKGVTPMKP